MSASSRKQRSRETEQVVADALLPVFPNAIRRPASIPGSDVVNTPGFDVEVKARRDLSLPAWLRQAAKRSGSAIPVVVHRPDGYGPERIDQWPVTMTMKDFIELVRRAQCGDTSRPMDW